MRTLSIIVLLTISLTVNGQKKSLLGKYTHSVFMYKYFLTLGDSGKFIIEEDSDTGLRTTTGTWIFKKGLITLTPTKCIWDMRDPEDKEIVEVPLSSLHKHSFISVDKENNLTKLGQTEKMDSTFKHPDYRLTKVLK